MCTRFNIDCNTSVVHRCSYQKDKENSKLRREECDNHNLNFNHRFANTEICDSMQ